MSKVVYKIFGYSNYDEEEQWLNEMAKKGFCLNAVGFCRYEFEECQPGEYGICTELFEHGCNSKESKEYISFLEETGIEYIGSMLDWGYFRKKKADEPFVLFSDISSRLKQLKRIFKEKAVWCGVNVCCGSYILYAYFVENFWPGLFGIVSLLVVPPGIVGLIRIYKKQKELKAEQQVFE